MVRRITANRRVRLDARACRTHVLGMRLAALFCMLLLAACAAGSSPYRGPSAADVSHVGGGGGAGGM